MSHGRLPPRAKRWTNVGVRCAKGIASVLFSAEGRPRDAWVGLLARKGRYASDSHRQPLHLPRPFGPSGCRSGVPALQWRDRAGLAPDFPVMPLVGPQADERYITGRVHARRDGRGDASVFSSVTISNSEGHMKILSRFAVIMLLLAGWTVAAIRAQITSNPIPAPIVKRGLAVEIRDLVRLPDTRSLRPVDQDVSPTGWARVSYVRDLPDGRRFANDSRGFLYLIGPNHEPRVYANVAAAFPQAVYNRLESGFIGFVFHPEFARNGLFYTVHAERAAGNPRTPDFIPPGFALKDVTYHNVITEWHATNPAAAVFEGTRRELLREAHVVANLTHPMGAVEFNTAVKPGDADYGLLYTSGSDHGFSNGGGPSSNTDSQTERLDSIITAILRFDPRSPSVTGGTKGLGDYTIPTANKFASDGDPKTLGEIYAYGFRNAHRLSWDTDGTMFASDIGMNQIEEINIV